MGHRATSALALVVLVAINVGCVQQAGRPDDCDAASVERGASLSGELLEPDAIDVCKGQEVTLHITSEEAGELHLHGYDDEAPGIEVEPGDTATFHFTAARAGQFPIELHDEETGSEAEAEVGLLTVHEP